MNISITRAVAAALAVVAVAPAASAASVGVKAKAVIGATTYTDISQVDPANVLYISGSTAVGPALKYWGIDTNDTSRLCQVGTATIYAESNATPKFTAVACLAQSAFTSGLSAGTPIAFIKEDAAGSLNGILPLQNKSVPGATYTTDGKLDFPVLTALSYGGTASSSTSVGCYGTTKSGTGLDTYMNVTCSSVSSVKLVPQLGYSDVEAAIFGVNTTGLTSGSTVELPFGVAVSAGFYHALQAVQGLTQDDTLANMPSLTRTEIASMMNQTYLNAPTQIVGTDGTTTAANASVVWGYTNGKCYNGTANTTTAVTSPCAAAVTSDTTAIYVCRRGDTSGSEKAAEIFLNDQNCTANTGKILGPSTFNSTSICTSGTTTDGCSWSSAYQTGVYSFTGGGTGDLLDCLVGQDNAGHFAIGFASVDNLNGSVQTNTTRRDFRYVRVDGVAPSIEAAAAGKYPFVAESVYYVPTTQVNAPGAGATALLSALTSSTQGLGTVGSIAAVDAALNNTTQGFHAGVLAIPKTGGAQPSNANAINATFLSNPVSTLVHEDGAAVNNCIRPQTYIGTNTTGTGGKYNWVPANN